jgi:hypothetical protein
VLPLAVALLLLASAQGDVVSPTFGSCHGTNGNPNGPERGVQIPSSEDLDQAADLIINGEVNAVQDSGTKVVSPYQDPSPPAPPEHIMHAFVRVLHTFKGMTDDDQIDFRYRVTAPNYTSTNNPNHAHLEAGHRYRFFLKQDDSGHGYVGALDGKIDDIYDVQALGPDEADDAPYLTMKDALAMARAFYATIQPPPITEVAQIWGDLSDPLRPGGACWAILFYPKDPKEKLVSILIADGKASRDQGPGQ